MATKRKEKPTALKDVTDRSPALPPEEVEQGQFDVTAVVDYWDGWQLHRQGERWLGTFPVDEEGEPVLPHSKATGSPILVRTEDYVNPEINLPGTALDTKRRVRGGASGMPSL